MGCHAIMRSAAGTLRRTVNPPMEFPGEKIVVTFDPALCISAGECIRGSRTVFPKGPRSTQPDEAAPDEIATIIHRCPSGALHYRRRDGGEDEQPDEGMSIAAQKGGPYYVRGNITVRDHLGNALRTDTRMALCRCGQSKNKPFCDGTHNTIAFDG